MSSKFHGITLANNSVIDNLHIERLATDPAVINAGRVWFNTTDKVFKQSTLDANGAVVIRTFATAEALAADVSALQTAIANEAAARTAADAALQASITALGQAIRYAGTVNPTTAGNLDLLNETNVGHAYKITALGTVTWNAGASSLAVTIGDMVVFNPQGGWDKLDATDAVISGTANFVVVSGSPDTGYTVDLAQGFKDRVTALETGLAAETASRQSAITAEAAARAAADATLQAAINAKLFTFLAGAPATQHVVTHNLNSGYVAVDVWVQGDDGKYRKDIVSVEETNNNTVTIDLTESRLVKVVVQNMTAVAA
jgi:hypothetical protein